VRSQALGQPEAPPAQIGVAAKPTEAQAFRFWLKLGFIGFGGPAGQIAIMHEELVERRSWISQRRFLHALNFCMALPGPEAQQLASYIGYSMYGVRGAVTAGGLFVLPSFALLCGLTAVYATYGEVATVEGVVRGLGAAVIALVAAAVLRVGGRVIRTLPALALAAAAFVLILVGVPFPAILALAALTGYLTSVRGWRWLAPAGEHDDPEDEAEADRSRSFARRLVTTLAVWLVPVAALLAVGGLVAQLAGFFTVAALVTFGGAYAVLPFVANAAVNHYGWLTAQDMIAGLALGESTPGPLIMVNTFVGFMAGYNIEGGLAWGLVGALVATLCTFVPSFVFIINGAPFIDRIRTTGAFASALSGMTIGVVGVIAALAVFVARHAAFPDGDPDWLVIGLAIVAFLAVWRFRVGVVPTVLACALVGLIASVLP
jgi:chromate transporter